MLTSLKLSPTGTYVRRSAVWVEARKGAYADHRHGTLTIVLQRTCRAGGNVESDSYAVEEPDSGPLDRIRTFYLTNITDPTAAEVYVVRIEPNGSRCNCQAGQTIGRYSTHGSCKHQDAIAALIDEGAIDSRDAR